MIAVSRSKYAPRVLLGERVYIPRQGWHTKVARVLHSISYRVDEHYTANMFALILAETCILLLTCYQPPHLSSLARRKINI